MDTPENIIYRKYEECSPYYILDIDYLSQLFKVLNTGKSSYQLESEFNQRIDEECYYNLRTDQIEDFGEKLRHNVRLAQVKDDHRYLNYIQFKFHLDEKLSEVDPDQWKYQPKKLKLKLKPQAITVSYYYVSSQLADMLSLEEDRKFKWKSEILKLVHQYIWENRLQDREKKAQINPDPKLKALIKLPIGAQNCTYFNLGECLVNQILAYHPQSKENQDLNPPTPTQ
jgi:hypothetical protein